MQEVMQFIAANIAYILLGVAILYFIIMIGGFIYSRKTGGSFSFRLKYMIPFLIIIGLGIYCLVTGQDISTFIN